jgi:TrmH family RNA methyltransferase
MNRADVEPITSLENPHVKLARSLLQAAGRRRHRGFLVEGLRLVEAATAQARPRLVLHLPSFGQRDPRERSLLRRLRGAGVPVRPVTERVLAHVTATVTPQGIVAVMPLPEAAPAATAPGANGLALILDGVSDPGNAGTLLRSAAGAGASLVLTSRDTVDVYSPKVVRAGAGAHFYVRLGADLDWSAIRQALPAGCAIWLADARAPRRYWEVDWTRDCAVIVSNEAHGPSQPARELATGSVSIPVQHVESLNAGVAGSILLFEARRQRAITQQATLSSS